MRKVTYYRSFDAEITDELFIRYSDSGRALYSIADIGEVTVEIRDGHWWELGRKRTFRLLALHRGTRVVLFENREERVFNMVTRALRRALENRTPRRPY